MRRQQDKLRVMSEKIQSTIESLQSVPFKNCKMPNHSKRKKQLPNTWNLSCPCVSASGTNMAMESGLSEEVFSPIIYQYVSLFPSSFHLNRKPPRLSFLLGVPGMQLDPPCFLSVSNGPESTPWISHETLIKLRSRWHTSYILVCTDLFYISNSSLYLDYLS